MKKIEHARTEWGKITVFLLCDIQPHCNYSNATGKEVYINDNVIVFNFMGG